MNALGVGSRDVLALVREAQRPSPDTSLLVIGARAAELAAALVDAGDPGVVRTAGNPRTAGVVVYAGHGPVAPDEAATLRAATRAGVPVVAVRSPDDEPLPYVLPGNVVETAPGETLPVDAVTRRIAAVIGPVGASLVARLPAMRDAARRRHVLEVAVAAGWLAAGKHEGQRLAALSLLQARMLRRLGTGGDPGAGDLAAAARVVGPELALSLAVGLGARTFRRRLPVGGRLGDAAVAGAVTLGLGSVVARLR